MLKKAITLPLLLLCVSSVAFANDNAGNSNATLEKFKPSKAYSNPQTWDSYIDTQNYPKVGFNYFYIQLSGALDLDTFPLDQSATGYESKDNVSSTGASGTVTFGVGNKVGQFYMGLAADATYNWTNYKHDTTSGGTDTHLRLKMPYSFGGYLVPGIFLSDQTLLYVKAGIVYSEFEQDSDGMASYGSFTKNLVGGRGGLGIRYYVNPSFSINTEYDFTYFGSFAEEHNGVKTEYRPYTNQISLGFAFHF